MERRFVLFLVLSFVVLLAYNAMLPRRPQVGKPGAEAAKEKAEAGGQQEKAKPPTEHAKPPAKEAKPPEKEPAQAPRIQAGELGGEKDLPTQWVTLGSADPNDPYRMLVTLASKGAAVARIELNSPRYHELDDRSGYLGHLVLDETASDRPDRGNGCRVQVVGAGTPAAKATLRGGPADQIGLRGESWARKGDNWVKTPGDLITKLDGEPIGGPASLRKALSEKEPNQKVELTVQRDGEELTLETRLTWRPLEVIRPEADDPLSLGLTLQQLDGRKIEPPEETVAVGEEIPGLDLWTGNWELLESDQTYAKFRRRVTDKSGAGIVEVTKSYRLALVPNQMHEDVAYPAYHLILQVEISNISKEPHTVAYQLDGPNGLPIEGAWYASTVSRAGGQAGLRDLVVCWKGQAEPFMVNAPAIADNKNLEKPWEDQPLRYIGVDAQYFAAVVLPQTEHSFYQVHPLRVGNARAEKEARKDLANTSFRIISNPQELQPGGEPLRHDFLIFAGPKKPDLLAQEEYKLQEVVYYGWPIYTWIAKPLVKILHGLYAVVCNYGLAIILLTALVRLCLFPLSKKQAINAQKMQILQPELKKLQEKYKKDLQARNKAQQELFLKHNYHPLSGCLVMLIQLPIFIGLYRALMVDVELRQAALIPILENLRWCSNLASPDMLFDWSGLWNWLGIGWVNQGGGMFKLGPYFNVLPILTIGLFIWQQKMFMPPPADEQAALQQKIMKYMMVFMGVLFYKVASGLCIYFIASSLWGMAERRFLPKTTPASAAKPESRSEAKAKAKAAQRPAASGRDGAAARKKNKNRGKKG